MAKIIDYPRASLENALQLAEAVEALGGNAKVQMAAERMGRKVSGAFSAVVSAAVKYSLVTSKEGRLATTSLFRDIRLAYSEEEERAYLGKALLSPPIFESIARRFEGKQLPVEHFDRLLIREFDVSDDIAGRVASYFLDGAKRSGMLDANNVLIAARERKSETSSETSDDIENEIHPTLLMPARHLESSKENAGFSVTFRGPGLNSTIAILDEDDVAIVEATLKKVTKALKSMQ